LYKGSQDLSGLDVTLGISKVVSSVVKVFVLNLILFRLALMVRQKGHICDSVDNTTRWINFNLDG